MAGLYVSKHVPDIAGSAISVMPFSSQENSARTSGPVLQIRGKYYIRLLVITIEALSCAGSGLAAVTNSSGTDAHGGFMRTNGLCMSMCYLRGMRKSRGWCEDQRRCQDCFDDIGLH